MTKTGGQKYSLEGPAFNPDCSVFLVNECHVAKKEKKKSLSSTRIQALGKL